MNKYFDKNVGRIINLLSAQEAMKITEMYVNHCIGREIMSDIRLNMISYLYDFMTFSDIEQINEFVKKLRENKLGNLDQEQKTCYNQLTEFFDSYKSYSKSNEINIEQAANYIIDMENRKKGISYKKEKNENLELSEKILNGLFINGFEFSSFASHICKLYEDKMKLALQNKTEIDIPLEEELAYYNLHDFSKSGEFVNVPKTETEPKTEKKEHETTETQTQEKNEVVEKKQEEMFREIKAEDNIPQVKIDVPEENLNNVSNREDNDVKVPQIQTINEESQKKEEKNGSQEIVKAPTIEIKEQQTPVVEINIPTDTIAKKKEEQIPQIQINVDLENEAKSNKNEEAKAEKKEEIKEDKKPQQASTPKKLSITADDILKATQEINANDAFGYFEDSIDRKNSNTSSNNDFGGFRD